MTYKIDRTTDITYMYVRVAFVIYVDGVFDDSRQRNDVHLVPFVCFYSLQVCFEFLLFVKFFLVKLHGLTFHNRWRQMRFRPTHPSVEEKYRKCITRMSTVERVYVAQ